VVISESDRDELVQHARDASPEECCGYMRVRDGRVDGVYRGENVHESSKMYGYMLDPKSMLAAYKIDEDEDGAGVAVYHSHPASAARPSQTDINLAEYDNWLYVIVSLEHADDPDVRCWRIVGGRVEEEDVTVEP
jgi:proteasome lid subunit RPN8/RPN11